MNVHQKKGGGDKQKKKVVYARRDYFSSCNFHEEEQQYNMWLCRHCICFVLAITKNDYYKYIV